MNKQPGIHYLREHQDAGTAKALPAEVTRIRDTVVAGLSDLLQGAFDAVDDSIFELANNARSNNEQNRHFEAMREIRIKRKGVEKQFQSAVISLFSDPPQSGQPTTDISRPTDTAESLSLLENDALEEQVALNAMANKARVHFQGPLLQLQTRFSQIYPGASDQTPVNPLAPEHLCEAFANAIEGLDINLRERLILLKQYDRYVISNLGMLLDEANRILIQAGVIPNFRHHGKVSTQKTARAGTDRNSEPTTQVAQSEQSDGRDNNALFDQIRQMLANQRTSADMPVRSSDPNLRVVADHELVDLLNRMTSAAPRPINGNLSDGDPIVLDLRHLVQQMIAKADAGGDGREPALNEADEDLINLVSMLFEFILDDYNLSAPVQVLISRLQIPILKVVLKDKGFFNKSTHPARRLLNSLARSGIGWSSSDEKAKDKLYNQIHTTVQRILDDFDGDISLFETLNEEFEAFLEKENRRASLVEQRTRESERGRIKSQKAQETVDQLLKEKVARYKLPNTIDNILINGWSRVLFLAYLRDDTEHRWKDRVRVVDDLIWCLRPHRDDHERDQWVRLVPKLLKEIRSGLEEVSYNSSRLDDMMGQIKVELTEAFRTNADIEASPKSLSGPDQPEAGAAQNKPRPGQQYFEDATMPEYIGQIDNLSIGHWVEFRLINGASFRCKLSAVIEEADTFVFVNRMGLKVIEKNRTELAQEMRRGRLTLLAQGALIDRALNAVVGNLRNKTP
ncbi:DUF1631 domain-containing protein [Marinobacter salinisoli]|uniref:DUF1631 domain-containing protein n=1 Tax=Marinobacter salinisoli TaxID=2769486 RepID=A0ABX7MYV5_9GAMM|nr:DUF1631 domain-containing protein [Marinobacter salinisoli]QSP96281.1 DUF1631 domain-containing protein [Marinobacter salinisoli]